MKKKTRAAGVVLVAVLLFGIAGAPLWGAGKQAASIAPAKAQPAGKSGMLRMKRYSCVDTKGIGTEAFSLLIPADWQARGNVRWVLDNPGMPAAGSLTVKSPDGLLALEMFPNQSLFWTTSQMHRATFPMGSKYFGAEVRPVAGPEEALRKIIVPRYRRGVSNLRVVSSRNLPDLARKLGVGKPQPGVETFGKAGKIRIEYVSNGVLMEEELFAAVEGFSFSMQTMEGVTKNTNWFVDYVFSFRAPKGKLDANSALFRTMVTSFKVNPRWYNRYNQVVENLIRAQIRQINSIGELSRIISRTNDEISSARMKQYEKSQKVYDGVSENFTEYMRNTENYHNPYEDRDVELPGGYSHVWTNASGEYVFSDSPSYNPNIGSNKNWQEMSPK